jgi:hypothetical protein
MVALGAVLVVAGIVVFFLPRHVVLSKHNPSDPSLSTAVTVSCSDQIIPLGTDLPTFRVECGRVDPWPYVLGGLGLVVLAGALLVKPRPAIPAQPQPHP